MSEERSRILKMLEEGKVTADQAARLIEALGAGPARDEDQSFRVLRHGPGPHFSRFFGRVPHPPRSRRVRAAELDQIPDIVASAVSAAMKSGFGPAEDLKSSFPSKDSLFLKCVSGDITIEGWDEDRISLEGSGAMTRIREREERVMVRSISGDIGAKVPHKARLELTSVSGDIKVSGVEGKIGLRSVSGDVDLTDLEGELNVNVVSGELEMVRVGGELRVETKSGDVEFEPAGTFSGEIVSKSGDIELRVEPSADVILDLACEEDGDITVDLEQFEKLEEGEGRLKLKLGAGNRVLTVRTGRADITVRRQ